MHQGESFRMIYNNKIRNPLFPSKLRENAPDFKYTSRSAISVVNIF